MFARTRVGKFWNCKRSYTPNIFASRRFLLLLNGRGGPLLRRQRCTRLTWTRRKKRDECNCHWLVVTSSSRTVCSRSTVLTSFLVLEYCTVHTISAQFRRHTLHSGGQRRRGLRALCVRPAVARRRSVRLAVGRVRRYACERRAFSGRVTVPI